MPPAGAPGGPAPHQAGGGCTAAAPARPAACPRGFGAPGKISRISATCGRPPARPGGARGCAAAPASAWSKITVGAMALDHRLDLVGLARTDEQAGRAPRAMTTRHRVRHRRIQPAGQFVEGLVERSGPPRSTPTRDGARLGRRRAARACAVAMGELQCLADQGVRWRGNSPPGPAPRWRSRACRPSG